MPQRKRKAHWSDNYPWYEHHRCCDQQYARDKDEWTADELAELRAELLNPAGDPIHWDVSLWLHGVEAGCMRIDLRRVFDGVIERMRYARVAADGNPETRLSQEEIAAPLSDDEVATAIDTVARIANEAWYETGLLEDLHREVGTVRPAVDAGPEATFVALRSMWTLEDLRSRRFLRALQAIVRANEWQDAPDGPHKRRLMKERPERYRPIGVKTRSLVRQLGRLVTRRTLNCRPPGRPRETSPTTLRERLATARTLLAPLHKRAHAFRSDAAAAGPVLAQEYPEIMVRLAKSGLVEEWFHEGPFDLTLEEMAAQVVAVEHSPRLSPSTVRRYARGRTFKGRMAS